MDNTTLDKSRAEFEAWWDSWADPNIGIVEHTVKREAAIAAWQAAKGLDADEMRRLRRLVHVLGMDGSERRSDGQVRGLLFTALGQAAGKIESAALARAGMAAPTELTDWRDTIQHAANMTHAYGIPALHKKLKALLAAPTGQQEGTSEQDARDAERFRWIDNNCRTTGGGNGFTLTCFVPVDKEDIGCTIDAAMSAAQAQPKDTTKGQA